VPEGVVGRVVIDHERDHAVPVAYGEGLFRVVPVSADAAAHDATGAVAPRDPSSTLHVVAPTDGVYYRAPSAGAKAYVAVGDRVTAGQAVGLIEVMKTFNPIVYGGATLPETAEVIEVIAADGQEVRAGQPLIAVR
jgi:acetyl-CoA carboxylase biotin carboxyl carrier protein